MQNEEKTLTLGDVKRELIDRKIPLEYDFIDNYILDNLDDSITIDEYINLRKVDKLNDINNTLMSLYRILEERY